MLKNVTQLTIIHQSLCNKSEEYNEVLLATYSNLTPIPGYIIFNIILCTFLNNNYSYVPAVYVILAVYVIPLVLLLVSLSELILC